MIHRDLKPANVIVSPGSTVKIVDFGLAKRTVPTLDEEDSTTVTPKTAEGLVLGTVAYMSPEQAEGRPIDPRSDVFSFEQLQATPFCQNVLPGNSPCGRLGLVSTDTLTETEQEGYAAFGEFTFDITRTLSATIGGRYHDQTNKTWTLAFAPDTPRRSDIPGHLPAGDLWKNAGRTAPRPPPSAPARMRADSLPAAIRAFPCTPGKWPSSATTRSVYCNRRTASFS